MSELLVKHEVSSIYHTDPRSLDISDDSTVARCVVMDKRLSTGKQSPYVAHD